ncbi:FecR domain-containing protein [Spirosoma daeguense]
MADSHDKELLRRYVADQCSATEREQAETLLATPDGLALMQELIDDTTMPEAADLPAETESEKALQNRVWDRLQRTVDSEQSQSPKVIPLRRYWSYAAAATLAGLGLFWFWQTSRKPSEHVAFRQIVAPAGQKVQVKLPDGTQVWLNAQSRLRYATTFGNTDQRIVELEGEAYFDVAHDKQHPFIVRSGTISTRVLGTQFNVRAYADDPDIEVAVLSGKVRVSDAQRDSVNLVPNQKSHFDRQTHTLHQQTIANVNDYRAWTTDQLILENLTIAETVRLLNRRFAVQIQVPQEKLRHCQITTRFEKPSLPDVLTVLCSYLNATYQQRGSTIIITGKGC